MIYHLSHKYPARRAFVTGAGGGLGRQLALSLAADGWTIGITDIKDDALDESARLIEHSGGKALTYHFDVSDKQAFKHAFDGFLSVTDGIDLLINNAGVGDSALFEDYSLEHWEWITGVNLMSAIYGCHYAVPVMKRQGHGHIISIASAAGYANMPNMSMYNVTKAGVISLMETLHAELHGHGIGVSVVCPTFFRSGIMQHRKGSDDTGQIATAIVERARHTPEDVAYHVLTVAGKGIFHIKWSMQSKFVYHFKRFFPRYFLKYKARQFAREHGMKWLEKVLRM